MKGIGQLKRRVDKLERATPTEDLAAQAQQLTAAMDAVTVGKPEGPSNTAGLVTQHEVNDVE